MLSTPIAHSIRQHDPLARIDYLVLKGNEGILEGNPDIDRIIALPHRTSFFTRIYEYKKLWRQYDVALSPVSSDRARLYGFIAANNFFGFYNEHTSWISKLLLSKSFLFDDLNTHTVTHGQKLLSFLNIKSTNKVVPPFKEFELPENLINSRYIVIHPYPKFPYKMWDKLKWIDLITTISNKGIKVVLTGSKENEELLYCNEIEKATNCINLSGNLSLGEVGYLISRSISFIGVDTGITHIAAATGVKTIALFGPTNPVKWGPWPKSFSGLTPWKLRNNPQIENVTILQGQEFCVPCMKEGCQNKTDSTSICILKISPSSIIKNLEQFF